MSEFAIEVSHLTKQFRVWHLGSLKTQLIGAKQAIFKRKEREHEEPRLALQDVSFTVPHGQTVAVIGWNGSGKSTLLGLLAHVYRPTSGEVHLRNPEGGPARLAPLLELGAGFHPELDGYENV